jgi:hypothetical protein
MRGERTGPAYFKVGHAVRYRAADVRVWIEAMGRSSSGSGLFQVDVSYIRRSNHRVLFDCNVMRG